MRQLRCFVATAPAYAQERVVLSEGAALEVGALQLPQLVLGTRLTSVTEEKGREGRGVELTPGERLYPLISGLGALGAMYRAHPKMAVLGGRYPPRWSAHRLG